VSPSKLPLDLGAFSGLYLISSWIPLDPLASLCPYVSKSFPLWAICIRNSFSLDWFWFIICKFLSTLFKVSKSSACPLLLVSWYSPKYRTNVLSVRLTDCWNLSNYVATRTKPTASWSSPDPSIWASVSLLGFFLQPIKIPLYLCMRRSFHKFGGSKL
jgi:hypothetical protein